MATVELTTQGKEDTIGKHGVGESNEAGDVLVDFQ